MASELVIPGCTICVGLLVAAGQGTRLNILSLGDEGAHALGLNAPMVNDPYYGFDGIAAETPATPLNLHAAMLDFPDPVTGERRRFETEPAFHL